MKNISCIFAAMLLGALAMVAAAAARDTLSLAGMWHYSLLEPLPDSVAASGVLPLPGTLHIAGVGTPVPDVGETSHLSLRYAYTGRAVYTRSITIPESWQGRAIALTLERTRPSVVTVDGREAGRSSLISAPQRFDLSHLTPGNHILEITVDNGESIPEAVRQNSHACAAATQTNWNGIIGHISLSAVPRLHIAAARAIARPDSCDFMVECRLSATPPPGTRLSARLGNNAATMQVTGSSASLRLPVPVDLSRWSEWSPDALHTISLALNVPGGEQDRLDIRVGNRKFAATEAGFVINGDPVFLRGRHDACVFPLTAHVPMDIDTWRRYFRTIKAYGLNHVRFHSWCPPEACFAAADEAGVYLQPELPIWGAVDDSQPALMTFLRAELEAIAAEYASHPSMVMMAVGNELWGDIEVMRSLIDRARQINPGLLATFGSNINLGWYGHVPGEDFLVTCRVGGGEGFSTHARASFAYADADGGGIMNTTRPNSQMTFAGAIARSPVPVVGHETGQYQFYPDFGEIDKYAGAALRPDNLREFRRRADAAGVLSRSADFFSAAGAWATKLYLADMEMNLRTPGMGGFQLLDLQDYPGQGTALVGVLDAFMDSKCFITPEQWRRSCAPAVVLAQWPKFCFSAGENASVAISVANFTNRSLAGTRLRWQLGADHGTVNIPAGKGLLKIDSLRLTIPQVDSPRHLRFSLVAETGEPLANEYDIWVYPAERPAVPGVALTTSLADALARLEHGECVVLCPDSAVTAATSLGPLFQTDYWNYRMFRTICDNAGREPSPGTMGLLIDARHPALRRFPTAHHTDWQWFAAVQASRPLIVDRLSPEVRPIVEVIDNIERAHRLSLLMECRVGSGRLLLLNLDPARAAALPEGAWLLQSVMEYAASPDFNPTLHLTPADLQNLLTLPAPESQIQTIHNESYH